MDASIVFLIAFIAIAAGSGGYWLGSRLRASSLNAAREAGRAESAIELAVLREKAAVAESRRDEITSKLTTAEANLATLQEESMTLRNRLSRAEEREHLLSSVEQELAAAKSQCEKANATLAEQREQTVIARAQGEASEESAGKLAQSLKDAEAISAALRSDVTTLTGALAEQKEAVNGLKTQIIDLRHQGDATVQALEARTAEKEQLQAELRTAVANVAQLQATLEGERTNTTEKLALLASTREDLLNNFKLLSAEVLEEKSQKFAQQNAAALGDLLNPVKEKLTSFQAKVEEVYRSEGQERAALGEQLKQLLTLNKTLSEDAQNLTRALKGDHKTQGTWGEIVLEKVLETAGLVEGTHFDKQPCHYTEEDNRAIPDVVLRLPGDRSLVIDSKVSLVAYERSISCDNADDRDIHLKQHVMSVRAHIKGLSERKYQQLYSLKSLDFVLLFVPLEPAFAAAISNDNQIFRDAWDRNVLLVSPSTLLFVVRTVAYLWRQESQTRNVLEIVRRGADLYDKLCGFVDDFEEIGERLQQAQKAYDTSFKKFSTGNGNVIRQAEMLKSLGVKPSKALPAKIAEVAAEALPQSIDGVDMTGGPGQA